MKIDDKYMPIIAGLENKARAVAQGHYDKDVAYDVEDRVEWVAVLYSAANKITSGKLDTLTGREKEEVSLATIYYGNHYDCFLVREIVS